MYFLRYALVSLISAALGVMLAFAAQHGGALLSSRDDAARLMEEISAAEFDESKLSYEERKALLNTNAIEEINLKYDAGFGVGVIYEITLRRDGSAAFVGAEDSSRPGKHTGGIEAWDFYRLSRLISQSRRFDLPAKYSQPVTDSGTYVTTIVQGDRSIVVSNYADAAPSAVWQVERIILGISAGVLWEPAT